MPTTDNGWPASPDLPLRRLAVNGVAFVPGIVDNDDVAVVLGYVADQFDQRVEPLVAGWCWGFAYRENRNNPDALSRHSGGIAIDVNAPAHPNGVPTRATFTAPQIAEVHAILAEVDHIVRWGGDYTGTPDAMHFEIDGSPTEVAQVATRLKEDEVTPDQINETAELAAAKTLATKLTVTKPDGTDRELTVEQALREVWQRLAKHA